MRIANFLALGLLVLLAACGGNAGLIPGHNAASETPAGATPTVIQDSVRLGAVPVVVETAEDAAGWQQLETNPGRVGVDYDPQRIMVTFLPNAKLPQGWAQPSPLLATAAASAANSELRDYKQFEPLAAAIAARYGLHLRQQVYKDTVIVASFDVPAGTNTAAVLSQLRQAGAGMVAHCVYEPLRHMSYSPNDPDYTLGNAAGSDYSAQWGHHRVHAGEAWDYTQGDPSIIVAVCDTGVRITHEELVGQVLDPTVSYPNKHLNVAGNNNNVTDNVGHGTYCAGLIGSKGNDAKKIVGLAFGCKIMPIKISENGTAADSDIFAGCMLADSLGAHVINLSFGGPNADPQLKSMVDSIAAHGKFFAIAAGNDNTTTKDYPGYYSDICVGATGGSQGGVDDRAPYSNYGTYVDIAAPGTWLKSCLNTGDTAYPTPANYESGTSFATPLVCAGAALLLSYDPTLTRTQLITALETTGDPTTNFQTSSPSGLPVLRMNLANAFDSVAHVRVHAPLPTKLIQSGTLQLTPSVNARAKSVDCLLNGVLVSTLTSAPWTFDVDTSAIPFGAATVQFIAHDGVDSSTADLNLIVDNTAGTYPLMENFTNGDQVNFAGVDAKAYATGVMAALNNWPNGTWTPDAVASGGAGQWSTKVPGGNSGAGAYCGIGASTYGGYELDALVSRKLTLGDTDKPTLVFQQHYNVEDGGSKFDKVRVLVTADGGQTFAAAKLAGTSTPAQWSGYQSEYIKAEVDLNDFAGQTVNVVLLFQSDAQTAGENSGAPAGWWVDSIVLSSNYSTNIPTIGGAVISSVDFPAGIPQVNTQPVVGVAPGLENFDVKITTPSQVNHVLYWLDLAPFNSLDLYDPFANVSAGPDFKGSLKAPNKRNQEAILRVKYFDAQNNPGPELDIPVHLFNLAGDTDANGTVEQADLDGYLGKLGLTSTDPGYSVFFDTDLDGKITEADAAGVGYNWGKSL